MDEALKSRGDEVRAQMQKAQYEFLLTELITCSSTLDFGSAEWKLGEREVAERELEAAEKIYASIRRFLPELDSAERRDEIEEKLVALRAAIDGFRHKLGLGGA